MDQPASCARWNGVIAGHAEEHAADDLHEAGAGQRPDDRQHRRDERAEPDRLKLQALERPEIEDQLAHEAIEGWEAADGHGAQREQGRGPWEGPPEPAHPVDVARARRVDDHAGGQEEQCLEDGVVPDVEHRRPESEDHEKRRVRRAADDGQTDAHHDDADVLDAVVREESLDVVLRNGERDSGDAARRPEQEQQDSPGDRRLRQHLENADDPVDADLDEDTRHQGGYVARSARMGGRKPHVERHHAGLDAKGDEGQKEQHAPRPEPDASRRDGRQLEGPGESVQRGEHREQHEEARVGCGQVHPSRLAHLGSAVFGRHQKECGQRHHLERHQEQHGVSRDEERGHRSGQEPEKDPNASRALGMRLLGPVADPVDPGERRNQESGEQEGRADPVDGDQKAAPRKGPGPRETRARSGSRRRLSPRRGPPRRRDRAAPAATRSATIGRLRKRPAIIPLTAMRAADARIRPAGPPSPGALVSPRPSR